jgi:hypothetical protein
VPLAERGLFRNNREILGIMGLIMEIDNYALISFSSSIFEEVSPGGRASLNLERISGCRPPGEEFPSPRLPPGFRWEEGKHSVESGMKHGAEYPCE